MYFTKDSFVMFWPSSVLVPLTTDSAGRVARYLLVKCLSSVSDSLPWAVCPWMRFHTRLISISDMRPGSHVESI